MVITSYATLAHQLPKEYKKPPHQQHQRDPSAGVLLRASWYRIILDEAHTIRNRTTTMSLACWGLTAKKRWCLTGTPVQNTQDDLFAILRFLHIQVGISAYAINFTV